MFDLNLVRTFVALYEAGSVTAAAQRLHVTQPSVSYGLGRLRERLSDPLFVRERDGMQPTTLATRLYPALRTSLGGIDQALAQARSFDPARSDMRFRIALTDLGEVTLLPEILGGIQASAPAVEVEVVPLEIETVARDLARARIDVAICSRRLDYPGLQRDVVLEERYVCLARAGHPRVGASMERSTFLDENHVVVNPASGHGLVEDVLRDQDICRKISLVVPHFWSLPYVVGRSDLLAIVPLQIATRFADQAALTIHELPFPVPAFEVGLYSHGDGERSPAHHWFRDTVLVAARRAALGD